MVTIGHRKGGFISYRLIYMKITTKVKAFFYLLATVMLWSVHAIVSRELVQEIAPMFLSLLRMGIAAILFLPFILKSRPWKKPKFNLLLSVSALSAGNVLFFIWGVKYTTASASQLIYAAIPIIIVFINIFIFKEKVSWGKIIGVLLGIGGLFYIVYLSSRESGTTIVGDLKGNLAVLVAVMCWTAYILFSKKLSRFFSPMEIGGISVMTAFVFNLPLAVFEYFVFKPNIIWNWQIFSGVFYMGAFGTFLAYIFYQYAIKSVSPLTIGLSSYIQPVTTAILASIFIGEKLTASFLFGSTLIFSGIFLTTTLEIYKSRR